ncbi:MAG: mechanosensitive ion channel family protein [Ktedonobacteraceae bacterium]
MSFQPVINALIKILTDIINFIPLFVNGLIILIVGYLISALVRWILRTVFRQIRFNQLADRAGITNALSGLGVRVPLSEVIAQIVFFFLLLSFATSAVGLMGLAAVADLLQNVLRFIPKAISAAIIIIFGSMLARFLGNTITTVAGNINITYSKALGKIIEYALLAFVIVLAVSTLGIDTAILTTSLTIIIASTGLAIALTFAFGAREAARNVIAGHYVRQNFQPGQQLTLGDYSGKVRSTLGTYTVLESTGDEKGTISLPNSFLLQNAVMGQEEAPATTQAATPGTTDEAQNPPETSEEGPE